MTATYTFDVFTSLDGFGAHRGNWAATGASKTPSCLNLAARATKVARAGSVLVPETLTQKVADLRSFAFHQLGPRRLKGFAEP